METFAQSAEECGVQHCWGVWDAALLRSVGCSTAHSVLMSWNLIIKKDEKNRYENCIQTCTEWKWIVSFIYDFTFFIATIWKLVLKQWAWTLHQLFFCKAGSLLKIVLLSFLCFNCLSVHFRQLSILIWNTKFSRLGAIKLNGSIFANHCAIPTTHYQTTRVSFLIFEKHIRMKT